ncbi:MAG: 50S ribosomal protein L25 [Rhodospirillales bacterium]
MRRDVSIDAEPRAARGKNESRRLRAQGLIPAVLYGAYKDTVALAVNPKDVIKILHSKSGHNTIFNVDVRGGESSPAMFVDWQYDPVRDTLLHVDLKRIDLSKRIRVSVPVLTHGEPKGVKVQGGLLEIVTREVEIECLPDEIPEQISVDTTELMIGQSIRAGDLPMEGSMKLVSSADNVIAHVVALRAEAAPTAEAAPEAAGGPGAGEAEPQVIKRGKKEEEGEAEAKKK